MPGLLRRSVQTSGSCDEDRSLSLRWISIVSTAGVVVKLLSTDVRNAAIIAGICIYLSLINNL